LKTISSEQQIKIFEQKQYLISALVFFGLCSIAVVLNAVHLRSVARENTQFLSRMIKIGDFREASLILQAAHLANFKVINYQSLQVSRSFILPPEAEFQSRNSLLYRFLIGSVTVPTEANLTSDPVDQITFEYERFQLLPYAFLAWIILNLFSIPQTRFMKRRLIEKFNEDLANEKKLVRLEVANEVRHNLRTPLAALMKIPDMLNETHENERELLNLTISQIRGLITKLDGRVASPKELNIYHTLQQAFRETQLCVPLGIEFFVEIDETLLGAHVDYLSVELRAILGNLVTNSIEALGFKGKIQLFARDHWERLEVLVIDSGIGIAKENLAQIFDRNFSFGKESGSGIGLSHAKLQIESWGGTIHVQSQVQVGTTISIELPIRGREKWCLHSLRLSSDSRIIILEDQKCLQNAWRMKLNKMNLGAQAYIGSKLSDFNEAFEGRSAQSFIYLFDHDLGENESGLELLKKLPRESTRCLLTGYFDDPEIQKACIEEEIFLIPKSQMASLELKLN
jgi:signal transduction histidine kinase